MSAAPDPVPCTYCRERIEDPRHLVCTCQAPYHIRCWTGSHLRCATCGGRSYRVTDGPPLAWRDVAGTAASLAAIVVIVGLVLAARGHLPWPTRDAPARPATEAPASEPALTPEAPG